MASGQSGPNSNSSPDENSNGFHLNLCPISESNEAEDDIGETGGARPRVKGQKDLNGTGEGNSQSYVQQYSSESDVVNRQSLESQSTQRRMSFGPSISRPQTRFQPVRVDDEPNSPVQRRSIGHADGKGKAD